MNRVVRVALPVVILCAGVLAVFVLVITRPKPPREPREETGTLVEIQVAEKRAHRVTVRANGTVTPARQVSLTPEIAGRVSWVSERLVPGGKFQQGELLVRLDAREHRLALGQHRAEVDRARTELEIERGRAAVAKREWEIFAEQGEEEGGEAQDRGLALREPQLRTAEAAVKASQSGLERAELNVQRTRLKAPFNALVMERSVDVGQYVAPGAPVASLVGTDEFWVQVSVPVEQLDWIDIPGIGDVAQDQGSTAKVVDRSRSRPMVREGQVIQLLGDVDPAGRMARVIVAVADPFGLEAEGDGAAERPLLAGSYVEVEIAAKEVASAVQIPRVALRDGERVFLMDDDERLAIRDVSVAWRDRETVLVVDGLGDGDRVIVSPVPAPAAGMMLRHRDGADDAAESDAEQHG